jgi:hypothetical protein
VKLLFDENLSGSLPRLLADVFPDSADVVGLGPQVRPTERLGIERKPMASSWSPKTRIFSV